MWRHMLAPVYPGCDEVAEHFEGRSGGYDAYPSWVNDRATLVPILSTLRHRAPQCVVDVGSGTGAVLQYLVGQWQPERYVALDVSRRMLEQCDVPCTRVVGRAESLPLQANIADLVICRQVLHYVRNLLDALHEMRRILTESGALLICQIVPFDVDLDEKWWTTAVAIRQPLRRHLITASQAADLLKKVGYSSVDVFFVESRSSLESWIARYPLPSLSKQVLRRHFAEAPQSVRAARHFKASADGDLEYSLRWMFALANR